MRPALSGRGRPEPLFYGAEAAVVAGGDTIRTPGPADPSKGSNNPLACTCGCGRRIRAARTTLAQGPILCGLCNDHFQPNAGRAAQLATA